MALRATRCGAANAAAPTTSRPGYTCEWCFGPLEVAYDYDAIAATVTRETIAAGPPTIWRYADLLPVEEPTGALPVGWTPLVRADRLAEALGLGEVWVKNDTRNPTNSFKDRVVAVALAKALDFGFKTIACASTGNLANSVAAHVRAGRAAELRVRPRRPRAGQDRATAVYGGNRRRGRRQLRRRQPALRRADRRASVGVRERQRAALLRRRVQDAGLRDRRAARLAGPGPRRGAGRQRRRCSPRSRRASRSCTGWASSTTAARSGSRARRRLGCSPVATAFVDGHRHDPAGEARHDRQVARDRQPGRRATSRSTPSGSTGGGFAAVTDDEIVDADGLLARTEGIFGETAAGVTIATLRRLAAEGVVRPDERVVVYVTGHGLKTLDAFGDVGPTATIAPTLDSFRAAFPTSRRAEPCRSPFGSPPSCAPLAGGASEVAVDGRHRRRGR